MSLNKNKYYRQTGECFAELTLHEICLLVFQKSARLVHFVSFKGFFPPLGPTGATFDGATFSQGISEKREGRAAMNQLEGLGDCQQTEEGSWL